MKDKRLMWFKYSTSIAIVIVLAVVILILCADLTFVMVKYPEEIEQILFPVLFLPWLLFALFAFWWDGILIPIFISDEGIECRGELIPWDGMKITAFCSSRGAIWFVIGTDYLSGRDLKRKARKGYGLCVTPKRLQFLLPRCNSRVLVLNSWAETEIELLTKRKINVMINEHNRKFD